MQNNRRAVPKTAKRITFPKWSASQSNEACPAELATATQGKINPANSIT
jgi:hypothetical protein